jgi:hypothetical protein
MSSRSFCKLPNTFLAGAQKSGTTALCQLLDAHPHCAVSKPKETNFLSRAENVSRFSRYETYFKRSGPLHRVRIDGTTTYMADPGIASRIRACLGGGVKIIFVLRSPIARTYSGFLHMVKRGHERRTADEVFLQLPDTLEDALAAERVAIERALLCGRVSLRPYAKLYDDVLWNYRYVGNSAYCSLVAPYVSLFDSDKILILAFEDLTGGSWAAREALATFLNVDPALFPSMVKSNVTRLPDASSLLRRLVEQARWINRRNFTVVRPYELAASPITPSHAVQEKLSRILAPEIAYWSRCFQNSTSTVSAFA